MAARGIHSLRFNQDQGKLQLAIKTSQSHRILHWHYLFIGCFTCCMESGLRIYNVDPLVEKAHFDNDLMGSISMAEMLWRTNVIAVVGGGNRAKFADNTVLIYDDLSKKFVMEVTFTSLIKAVRLRRDKYVILCFSFLITNSYL